MRTESGRPIRAAVVRVISEQVERYERALKLVEKTEAMVESEHPPPPNGKAAKKE